MRVVLGSRNEPKRLAVLQAFLTRFPQEEIIVDTVPAESGVADHPTSAAESIKGALNRADHASRLAPRADYYVGIEGGNLEVDGRVWEHGWVAIANAEGITHTGVSAGVELSGKMLAGVRAGTDLNQLLDEQFNIKDAGKANGFYGLVSDDAITRDQVYMQAIIFALAPFTRPEFFE